jgi:hypothetical protein
VYRCRSWRLSSKNFRATVKLWPIAEEGSLANLPWTDDRDRCLPTKGSFDPLACTPRYHPCILKENLSNCKIDSVGDPGYKTPQARMKATAIYVPHPVSKLAGNP